jgi:acyl-coenzyme A thioesterase PaaI-like protein
MPESTRTRLLRWGLNFFPAYRGTGARIDYIAADWREIRIHLPLSWRTRNYVGTIFGGSMFGAVDPIPMVMLIRILGPEFVVWDRASTIRYLRPGRTTLYSTILMPEDVTEEIKSDVASLRKIDREFELHLKDAEGVVHATCVKTLYIRQKKDR